MRLYVLLVLTALTTASQAGQKMRQTIHTGNEMQRIKINAIYYSLGKRGPGDKFLGHEKYFNYDLGEKRNFSFSFVHSEEKEPRKVNFIRVAVLQDSADGQATVQYDETESAIVLVRAENTHFCAASAQFYGQ